jgi:hypothetical protein
VREGSRGDGGNEEVEVCGKRDAKRLDCRGRILAANAQFQGLGLLPHGAANDPG